MHNTGHYAKVLLDAFFNARNLRGEILWGPARRANSDVRGD